MITFIIIVLVFLALLAVRATLHTQSPEVRSPNSPPSGPLPSPRKGPSKHKTRKAKPKRLGGSTGWIPKDGNVRVGGRNIGGMVFVGRGPRADRYSRLDNAFIDPSKKVAPSGDDYDGLGMDYWPNYSTIDARSRATYLDWLSSGRSDPRCNAGYVFLYFYGLERRVFVDKTEPRERAEIIAEVRRLLELYGNNQSIRRYLGAFIDTTSLLESSGDVQPVFKHDGYDVPPHVLISLGRMAARGVPLTSDWILS